ncbi:HD domain-containing protein [Bacteroides sp.]|uniref:3'-5' exoribonuclease YhaM family protein n=1 Tax=Bacteroides sp. TaxID=29523 RepID=UPI00263919B2|nr:HD domain-containing protein [Bacteroides sp.]MDD3040445.1 HD domain-containing protein [Bacteroides sp.]
MRIRDLKNGETFTGFVVVKQSNVSVARNGSKYVDMKIFDGEKELYGKIWDHKDLPPQVNEVIKIQAILGEYNNNPQLTIKKWRIAAENEYSPAEFLPVYQGDRIDLFCKLLAEQNKIMNQDLKNLLSSVLVTWENEIIEAPAAIGHHHVYIGGLLVHTCSVLQLALNIAENDPDYINMDLIRVGAILHDIGKIRTYDWEGNSFEVSDDGHFLDHIIVGILMIQEKTKELNVPWETTRKLLHIIASHHGKFEWGSPVEPSTKEALIIHQADLADGTINKVTREIQIGIEENKDWVWPKGFKRPICTKQ